jgi:methyl-accepting chemotaxis protein
MNRYWIRIVLGALGIFLVGTAVFYAARSGRQRVAQVVASSEPITIPLAFIPFKVDGRELGTLSRLQIMRSSPKQVEALNFRVKLADSVADERLGGCILVAGDNGMNFQANHINPNAMFHCATAGDTAGKNLAPLGSIETQRGNTFVLLSGADALRNFDMQTNGNTNAQADSISAVYEKMADSVQQAADSMSSAAEARADSLRAVAETRADSVRSSVHAPVPPHPPTPPKARVRVKVN